MKLDLSIPRHRMVLEKIIELNKRMGAKYLHQVGDYTMPFYAFQCPKCECRFERLLKIADRDTQQDCPECVEPATRQVEAPMMMDPVRAGVTKVPSGFKEVLHKIHEKTPGSRLNESANF